MGFLSIIKGLVWAFLLKIFPSLGYKGTVDTQISVYNRLKRKFPAECENDLLNTLIMSRIEAPPRVATKQEEYTHYEPILQNPDKTLEDVIWGIVEYEYILSREEHLLSRLSRRGFSQADALVGINEQKAEPRRYIRESIQEKCGDANMRFTKLTKDYKSFLWIFFVGLALGVLETKFVLNMPDSILLTWSIVLSLGWLFYTIKVVIDTFKVFKIIKPSRLQIGISIFLFWLFFCSPLVMGLYVVSLINRYKKADRFDLESG